jgi:hypothetical protein
MVVAIVKKIKRCILGLAYSYRILSRKEVIHIKQSNIETKVHLPSTRKELEKWTIGNL